MSALAVPVSVEGREEVAASLNLYSRLRDVGTLEQETIADSFAAEFASALLVREEYRATARRADQIAEAMRTRAVIEQAKGILISEQGIDPDEAFRLLQGMSERTNTKLREVARRLVAERSAV